MERGANQTVRLKGVIVNRDRFSYSCTRINRPDRANALELVSLWRVCNGQSIYRCFSTTVAMFFSWHHAIKSFKSLGAICLLIWTLQWTIASGQTPSREETETFIVEMFNNGTCGYEGSIQGNILSYREMPPDERHVIDRIIRIDIATVEDISIWGGSGAYFELSCRLPGCSTFRDPAARREYDEPRSGSERKGRCNTGKNAERVINALRHWKTFFPAKKQPF
jgi:hypothetical protein